MVPITFFTAIFNPFMKIGYLFPADNTVFWFAPFNSLFRATYTTIKLGRKILFAFAWFFNYFFAAF